SNGIMGRESAPAVAPPQPRAAPWSSTPRVRATAGSAILLRPRFSSPCSPRLSPVGAGRGNRSLQHVGVGHTGRASGGIAKRNALVVVPVRPLEAPCAAHDRHVSPAMGRVYPESYEGHEEYIAVGRSE